MRPPTSRPPPPPTSRPPPPPVARSPRPPLPGSKPPAPPNSIPPPPSLNQKSPEIRGSFESRFIQYFNLSLPPVEPFRNCEKSYPSQNKAPGQKPTARSTAQQALSSNTIPPPPPIGRSHF